MLGRPPQLQAPRNYSMFPFSDVQNHDEMTPTLGSCFTNYTGMALNPDLRQQVDQCASNNTLCCYTDTDTQV